MSTEVLELPVDSSLATINKFEAEIVRLETNYSGLNIKDVNDKLGYKKVVEARKDAKSVRVSIDKKRKELVEDALTYQRKVNGEAKELTERVSVIEDALEAMEKDHEAKLAEIKAEAERVRKEKIQKRAQVITSFPGVTFNGISYTLGSFAIEQSEIESLSDADFQTNVEFLESEYKEILEARLESERIAKEEADRLEAQRKEQEFQAAELKRQQEELAAETKRIAAEQKAREDAILAEEKRIADEKFAHEAKIEAEKKAVEDAENARIAAEKRQSELEAARIEGEKKAKEEAELKAKQEAVDKAKAEKLAKDKEAKLLAKRPDIEKFHDMGDKILDVANSFLFKTDEGIKAHKEFIYELGLLLKKHDLKAE